MIFNKHFLVVLYMLSAISPASAASNCASVLWPNPPINQPESAQHAAKLILEKQAKKALNEPSHALKYLHSAGKTQIQDPELIATRQAFRDADYAAVLALQFTLDRNPIYLEKAKSLLLSWASVNHPTGNPIDETRLAGFIWSYDLISCDLSPSEKVKITAWLEQLRAKKQAWQFGQKTSINNHRIHQLKLLLLLDKVLHHSNDWKQTISTAIKYSTINIDPKTSESIDYKTRTALHYHNFDLQPWVEINLISHCCIQTAKKAFNFLVNRIREGKLNGEFTHSYAKIDHLRALGGFSYAKYNGKFNIKEASPTIIAYYTLTGENTPNDLQHIIMQTKPSPWLSFLAARKILWK